MHPSLVERVKGMIGLETLRIIKKNKLYLEISFYFLGKKYLH